MNLQQIRILRETVRQKFNLTEVANVLFTSQPGISKHIKDIEDELGIEIFLRKGKRLLGLTEPGKFLMPVIERILMDIESLRRISDQYANQETGHFVIATTHTQARYALPSIIQWFRETYPKIHLSLLQGSPQEIAQMLLEGSADVGIATEVLNKVSGLISFDYYDWRHTVIVPQKHPLLMQEKLTLELLSEYPIITYHQGFTGRSQIDEAFLKANLLPDIVMSAIDADVIKTYVKLGLGIGIVASVACDTQDEHGLNVLQASHLFPKNTTKVALRQGLYLRAYVYAFLAKLCPNLGEDYFKAALKRFAEPNISG